jgi:hypothetical protein
MPCQYQALLNAKECVSVKPGSGVIHSVIGFCLYDSFETNLLIMLLSDIPVFPVTIVCCVINNTIC